MAKLLRVAVVDDERPARRYLINQLKTIADVEMVGEAANGRDAVELIEQRKPELCLLDINMPEMSGLDVARLVKAGAAPLVVFVTAYDQHAIEAFDVNAIDYLLKPVALERLVETVERARKFAAEPLPERSQGLAAVAVMGAGLRRPYLERIPVRRRDDTVIVLVRDLASIVADGELLHLTTVSNERHTICHRLHALEAKLDPRRFVRLGRGTLVAVDRVQKFSAMPGGTYQVQLSNGQVLVASRIQSRALRESFLRI
jgi:two-component system LytT family response regulator